MAVTVTLKAVNADRSVVVNSSVDGKDLTLSNMPVEDFDACVAALKEYLRAYKAGLDQVAAKTTDVDPKLTAAVGKSVTVG